MQQKVENMHRLTIKLEGLHGDQNGLRPPRKEVLKELIKVTQHRLPLGIKRGKQEPDRKWMMNVIRTNKPDHRFFAKDYVPEKVKDDGSEESDKVSQNFSFFFLCKNLQKVHKALYGLFLIIFHFQRYVKLCQKYIRPLWAFSLITFSFF